MLGLDAQSTPGHLSQKTLVRRHISAIRERYPRSHIWFIPENNLGKEGSHLEKCVNKIPNLHTYYEYGGDTPGIRKSHTNTEDYQYIVEHKLISNGLRFDNNLFTVSKGHNSDSIMTELRNQLERYHWDFEERKTSHGKDKVVLTGKVGGAQDDLYVAFAMVIYWSRQIMKDASIRLNY